MDRILDRARDLEFQFGGGTLKVTCSAGVSGFAGSEDTAEVLVQRADGALYRAKEEGRDRVARG
jgi:diguanylate cyclase (GGDEF)-like protein